MKNYTSRYLFLCYLGASNMFVIVKALLNKCLEEQSTRWFVAGAHLSLLIYCADLL